MFIAHLPAGYLATRAMACRLDVPRGLRGRLMAFGLVCSVLPDADLLWFYLVDNRQTEHHDYVTHWPLFWIALAALAAALPWGRTRRTAHAFIVTGLICLLLHMALDSFAAAIYWLRPLSDVHVNAVTVPARFDWWVWNFVLHWTFAIEIAICLAAVAVAGSQGRRTAG
ncbi:inner membrane protein [Loktanella atrilutea]|uniref:Inner membrane protein n=1 Tax=Loktanella atrilutea TaxID=366533 RepID=A0A1M4WPN8_LOKAT|nr:metal-dependent hydrolase [Loktanella atrilutea]SHE83271.1 inner membrane protein [Loktanella atrilutea]